MRIAFVVNNFRPRLGGLESHVASLADHLVALGHEVHVFTLAETASTSIEHGVHVTRFQEYFQIGNVLGFPKLGTARSLRKALRRLEVDVVSVHTRFFTMTWIGTWSAKRIGIPVVHTEHGSGFVVSDSALISAASKLVDVTLGKWALRRADEILGVSENVLGFVKRLSGRSGRLFYNAIEPVGDASLLRKDSSHRFVFVGRVVPGKGWDDFVDVMAELKLQGHTFTAEMLGDGPSLEALRRYVDDKGVADRVVVRGRVSPGEVIESVSGATLLNPTRLAEGFQTTLLEALAANGRVITYPVAGADALSRAGAPIAVTSTADVREMTAAAVTWMSSPPAPAGGFHGCMDLAASRSGIRFSLHVR